MLLTGKAIRNREQKAIKTGNELIPILVEFEYRICKMLHFIEEKRKGKQQGRKHARLNEKIQYHHNLHTWQLGYNFVWELFLKKLF